MIYGNDRAARRQQHRLADAKRMTAWTVSILTRTTKIFNNGVDVYSDGLFDLLRCVYPTPPSSQRLTTLHRWLSAKDDPHDLR